MSADRQVRSGELLCRRAAASGGAATGASSVDDCLRRTIAGIAGICLGQAVGPAGGLSGGGRGGQAAMTARGTVKTWTAATGMAMAPTGMVTAAIGSAVATIGKAKAATGAVPTGTIATGMVADLVPIKGSRNMAATYNHLKNATEA